MIFFCGVATSILLSETNTPVMATRIFSIIFPPIFHSELALLHLSAVLRKGLKQQHLPTGILGFTVRSQLYREWWIYNRGPFFKL